MKWEYLTYKNFQLWDEQGKLYCHVMFTSEKQATKYIEDNDLRATIV